MEKFEKIVQPNSIETLSPEKQQLLQLEKEGKNVFHGTGADLEAIEPRQAIDMMIGPDGAPAVYASSNAEYAIFMAIINKYNCPRGSRSNAGAVEHDDGTYDMRFGATKDSLAQLTDEATGWVHVFDKKDFTQREDRGVEFVSHKAVKPSQKIKVSKADLPKNIEVTD